MQTAPQKACPAEVFAVADSAAAPAGARRRGIAAATAAEEGPVDKYTLEGATQVRCSVQLVD